MRPRVAIAALLATAVLAGCGGGDGASTSPEPTAADTTVEPADEPAAVEPADEPPADEPAAGPAEEPAEEPTQEATDGDAVGGLSCDDVFSVAEMTDFVGEPIELVASSEPALGQITCSWETVEDPDDADDLAFSFVFAQIFTGDPIPAANFVDPTFFDDVTMIDDLGDVAFWEESLGPTFYVLDGNVAGVFSYTDADLGNPEGPKRRTFDEVLELFREFHRRIT